MKQDKPPRKKVSTKRNNPEDISGIAPGKKEAPAVSERTDVEPATDTPTSAVPAPEKRERPRQPVTNQDEQEKITNASDSDLPIAE